MANQIRVDAAVMQRVLDTVHQNTTRADGVVRTIRGAGQAMPGAWEGGASNKFVGGTEAWCAQADKVTQALSNLGFALQDAIREQLAAEDRAAYDAS
jgi:WXG100 family type VII secretion target